MKITNYALLALMLSVPAVLAEAIQPLPWKVAGNVTDVQAFQVPDRVQLGGWIGGRISDSESKRLLQIDTARLLEGYFKRPGRQTWDGEHVGKWLHASTLAWANTGDPALRAKLDKTVVDLTGCQLEDGYLGTYLDQDRWTEWDVWAHKYNILGLLTYVQYTGNTEAMKACTRMADLLVGTFGENDGKRDLLKAGHHAGMAPTSVLEPMVLLYRMTGEKRYLDFCDYIVRSWETQDGPQIVSRLLELKRVDKVGNAKAYEMLSCLNGALEYHRLTGDPKILSACLNAWQDIVDHRIYLTGAMSYKEHFHDNFDLPNTNKVGETCVTVTWLQFNAQLLRLTGEARFAEQLEHVIVNQLFGAQRPDETGWGYYVQMEGKKPYSKTLDGNCCLSSGPRGIALIPTFAITSDADGAVVNLYETGKAALTLRDGTRVNLSSETRFPADAKVRIRVDGAAGKKFAVKFRIPNWSKRPTAMVSGKVTDYQTGGDGYAAITRNWSDGDVLEIEVPMEARVIVGDHLNQGKAAVMYGPLVLAADDALLAASGQTTDTIQLAGTDLQKLDPTPEPAPDAYKTWPGARVFRVNAVSGPIQLVPFADAGSTTGNYKVWIPLPANLDEKK